LQGFGLGFMFVPLSTIAFATLEPRYRTEGTALFSLVRNMGSSIGISIVVFLLSRNTQVMHSELVQHVNPYNEILLQPGVSQLWNLGTSAGRAALNSEITRQALIIAYADDFKLMMIVALSAMPLIFLLRGANQRRAVEQQVLE
jgi:MFS transporter, DHA2 family, multidrug resistance protein